MTARFAAALVALTLVITASLEIPLGVNHARSVQDDLQVATERDALALGDRVEDLLETDDPDAASEAGRVAMLYRDATGGRVLIVEADGTALADTDPPPDVDDGVGRSFSTRPEIEQALAGTTAAGTRSSATLGEDLVYVAVPVRSGDRILGAVRLSHSRHEIDEDIAAYWWRLAAIAGVSLVVAGVIGLLLGRWVSRPVRELQTQTRAFGRGDLDARADTRSGPPEIRELARQYNQSADRLAVALRTTSQFAADAAHQLRTPLTVLRLRIDNLRSGDDPVAHDRLDPLDDELSRLDRTIDVLLALARLDEQIPAIASTDLDTMIERAHTTWESGAAEADVTLHLVDGPTVTAFADPDHIEQILDNLLANAVAAVPAGSTIDLRAATRPDGRAILEVVDHGPGIDAATRERATQRHWHDSSGGSGLGLAIVDRLCQHGKATLELDDTPGGGLTARVVFPSADDVSVVTSPSG
ncbi:ATP-binding protein [Actinospongicola halichondriae]|uniref:sensor histidine kinase n=1 Tax=Actinospongicola halichondriae TaxID=3236844 RepID=UPI003D5B3BB1